jgi:hypothetical protein
VENMAAFMGLRAGGPDFELQRLVNPSRTAKGTLRAKNMGSEEYSESETPARQSPSA